MSAEEIEKKIREKLREAKDPEVGLSVVDLGLIDEVRYDNGVAKITSHPTTPFCPSTLSVQIGVDIYLKASEVKEVKKVVVRIKDHAYEKQVNELINRYIEQLESSHTR